MRTIIQILRERFMNRSWGTGSPSTGINLRNAFIVGLVICAGACHNQVQDDYPMKGTGLGNIIYDTFIINRDSTDTWGTECLANFNRQELIDEIFNEVYKGRIIPTDYFTGGKISPAQLRKMENDGEFSRKNISKIRFEEQWLWDKDKSVMRKQVLSIAIACEVFDISGKSRGQKPILRLDFNKR